MTGYSAIVAALILLLGANSWHTRERACEALAQLGPLAEPQLLLAIRNPDAEIRTRADRLVFVIHRQQLDKFLAEFQPLPWIDSVPPEAEVIHQDGHDICWWTYAPTCCESSEVGDWPSYRAATAAWVVELRDAGMSTDALRGLLTIMQRRCECYQRTGRYQVE